MSNNRYLENKDIFLGPSLNNIILATVYNAGKKTSARVPWMPNNIRDVLQNMPLKKRISIETCAKETIRAAGTIEKILINEGSAEFSKELLAISVVLLRDLAVKIIQEHNCNDWPNFTIGCVQTYSDEI